MPAERVGVEPTERHRAVRPTSNRLTAPMDSPSNDDAATRFYLHRETREGRIIWCLEMESNHRPPCYQHGALTTELPRRDTVARSPGRCQPVNESHESPASSCHCAGFEPETSEVCAPLRRSAKLSYSGDRVNPARITGTVCHAVPLPCDLAMSSRLE